MRRKSRRLALTVGIGLAGGIVFAGPGTGCSSFLGESLLTSADFCFIFDCQNGLLGGTVDPCSGTALGDFSGEPPLFTDCSGFVGP